MGEIPIFRRLLGSLRPDNTKGRERHSKPGKVKRISRNLNTNIEQIKKEFEGSSDFVVREFYIGGRPQSRAVVAFLSGMADEKLIEGTLTTPLMVWSRPQFAQNIPFKDVFTQVLSKLSPALQVMEIHTLDDAVFQILEGDCILFVEGSSLALGVEAKGYAKRGVEDPQSEAVVRGPREGFTDTPKDNIALIRKRLHSPNLVVEQIRVGRKSVTDVRILYLRDIAHPNLLKEVRRRLKAIDVDAVHESGIIQKLITDHPYSSFPVIQSTERPDTVVASILEGRIAIIASHSPFVLLVPMTFYHAFSSAEDHYLPSMISFNLRFARLIAFFLSLFITATYIALTSYHQELIPLPLLLNIAISEAGVPFPVFITAIVIELLLEILREAGVRLPRQVGQAVSIVGAIVLGQAAIEAGFAPPGLVIVAALGTIASFAIPSYETATSVRLVRFPLIILASIYGLVGLALGATFLYFHLASLKSFGVPYLTFGLAFPLGAEVHFRRATRPYGSRDKVRQGEFPDAEDPGPILGDES